MAKASDCRASAAKATNWSTKKMRGDEPRIFFVMQPVIILESQDLIEQNKSATHDDYRISINA